MCDTGRRFTQTYSLTPPTVYSALDDWAGHGNQSAWYSCKNFRLCLHSDGEQVYIRDLQKYDESYRDQYLDAPCKDKDAVQDALPVIDGIRFTDSEVLSGLYFGKGRMERTWREGDTFLADITADGKTLTVAVTEQSITVTAAEAFTGRYACKAGCSQLVDATAEGLYFCHNGKDYALKVKQGYLKEKVFHAPEGKLVLTLE